MEARNATSGGRSPLVEEALALARSAHEGQLRETDRAPYLEHPVDVASLVADAGLSEEAVAAGLLHDVVEDTEVRLEDISRRFGQAVADLVAAMTEDEAIADYEERKDAHRRRIAAAGPRAATLFVADKLANARDLRRLLEREGSDALARSAHPIEAKHRHYRRTLELFESSTPNLPLLGELRTELDRLGMALERSGVSPGR